MIVHVHVLLFLDKKVDGQCFLKLTEDELRSFGLPLGIKIKVQTLQKKVMPLKVIDEAL